MDEESGDGAELRITALERALQNAETRLAESERLCAQLGAELSERNDELARRVRQLKRAEQLARFGYWHADLRTGRVLWSAGMSSLLGFPAEEQTRASGEIYEYVHPEDRAAVREAVAAALAGAGAYAVEFRAFNLEGEEHHVRILGEIEFEHGQPIANFGVGQDITPMKRAEAALRENEARCRQQAAELALIYATAPVGLCVLDRELRFVHVNERLAEVNGAPVEAHFGRTVGEVVPAIARYGESLLRKVLDTGEPVIDFEMTGETPAQPGVQRTWVSQYWPLMDDDGKVAGINVVVEEITERRRLEETRRSERQFRSLAENSTDLVVRFDRSHRRIYVNRSCESLLGRPRGEIIGRTNAELGLPADLVDLWAGNIERAFTTGQPLNMELLFPGPEGERVLDFNLVPERGESGEMETLLSIGRDITERKRAETTLRESEQRYRRQAAELEAIYRFAPIGLAVLDSGLRILRINERLAGFDGLSVAAHLGRTVGEVVPAIAEQAEAIARRILETGEPVTNLEFKKSQAGAPGTERWWNEQWFPLKDAEGRVWGINVAVEEITARKHAEEILRKREQEFEALAEQSPDIIARVDRAGRFVYVNATVERVSGRPSRWFIGRTLAEIGLSRRERQLREEAVARVMETGREQVVEHDSPTPTGRRYFHARVVPEFDQEGSLAAVLIVDRDITEIKRAQFALEELTLHDPLTGIANRRYLSRFIDREWRREARHRHSVAIVMADIDFFKAYNDHYGHQRGDDCLRQVAGTLQATLRRPTDILVRYGGEEFAMVLLESDLSAATRMAETMLRAVEERQVPHEASSVAPVVTISLGVTAAPADRVTFKELLSIADTALYRAKHNGRNRVEAAPAPLSP